MTSEGRPEGSIININVRKEDVNEEVHCETEPDRPQNAFQACDKPGAKGLGLGQGSGNGGSSIMEIGSISWKLFHGAGWMVESGNYVVVKLSRAKKKRRRRGDEISGGDPGLNSNERG